MAPRQSTTDFSHSITDLMTSIAVVFVLLFLFYAQQQEQELSQTERTVSRLLNELQAAFGPLDINVRRRDGDPLTLEVALPESYRGSLTFRQNERALLQVGKDLLDTIVPKLLGIVCSTDFKDQMDSIVVEGHSSSEGKQEWNVELSAMRATETLLYSLEVAPEGDQRSCFEGIAAASGRGAWHPKLVGGEEDRDASRRVVFRIRVKSFEQRSEPVEPEILAGFPSPVTLGTSGSPR